MSIFSFPHPVLYVPQQTAVPVIIDPYAGVQPSYSRGFAKNRGESAYPQDWDGLVGAWVPSLGATGDKAFDIAKTNAGADMVLSASPSWVSDYLSFTAASSQIGRAPLVLTDYPVTINAKVYHNTTKNDGAFGLGDISTTSEFFGVYIPASTDQINIWTYTDGLTIDAGSNALTDGWHDITVVWKSSTERLLYVNGVYDTTFTTARTFPSGCDEAWAGGWGDSSPSYYDTNIQYLRIYNRALTASETAQRFPDPLRMFRPRKRIAMVTVTVAAAAGIPILRRRRECA